MQEVFEKIIEKFQKAGNIQFSGFTKPLITVEDAIKIVEQASVEYNNGWIPVTYHEITEEEREEKCISEEIAYYLDCKLPEDEEEILITRKYGDGYIVEHDTCVVEDGYFLDSGLDWTEVIAWQPLPEPYQKGESERHRCDCDMNCGNCEHQAECDEFSL